MAEWSNGCINYFDAFDLAILNYTSKLTNEEKKMSRKAVPVKKLLTIDGAFDKTLFDFILWIISDCNREVAFMKMCDIKFLHSKSDADLLKVFLVGSSRCFLEPSHLTWVLDCLQSWKRKCEKDKAPAAILDSIDEMMVNTKASFEEGGAGGAFPTTEAPETKEAKDVRVVGLDIKDDVPSSSELSADEYSPRNNSRSIPSFQRNPSMESFAPYMKSPSHKKSQSLNSLRKSQMDDELIYHQSKDAEIQNLRQLLNYDLPRSGSFREMPYDISPVFEAPVKDDYGLLLTTREQQIVGLQAELRRKNAEIAQLVNIKKSTAAFSTTDHSRLEKELRDMMKYYEKALGSKEAELVNLAKKIKEKKTKDEESESQAVKDLEAMKLQTAKDKEAHAEAIAKLEDDLKKSLIKYVTLHKNCELKLDRYRQELADKNKIIASHAKYSKKSDHARYLHSLDLENSVAQIKEAQKRLEKELDDTKIGRDTALLQVSTLENELRNYRNPGDSENSNPNSKDKFSNPLSTGNAEAAELRVKLHTMQIADLELKKELRDTRENLRQLEVKYEETLLAQDVGTSGGIKLSEKLKLETELKVMRNNYEQLKSATDKIVSYEESRSKYITSLENKLRVAAEEKIIIEKEFIELKNALEMFKPWEGTQLVKDLRDEMKRLNSYDVELTSSHEPVSPSNKAAESGGSLGIAGGKMKSSLSKDNAEGDRRESFGAGGDNAETGEMRYSDVQKAKVMFQKKLNITQNMIIANE